MKTHRLCETRPVKVSMLVTRARWPSKSTTFIIMMIMSGNFRILFFLRARIRNESHILLSAAISIIDFNGDDPWLQGAHFATVGRWRSLLMSSASSGIPNEKSVRTPNELLADHRLKLNYRNVMVYFAGWLTRAMKHKSLAMSKVGQAFEAIHDDVPSVTWFSSVLCLGLGNKWQREKKNPIRNHHSNQQLTAKPQWHQMYLNEWLISRPYFGLALHFRSLPTCIADPWLEHRGETSDEQRTTKNSSDELRFDVFFPSVLSPSPSLPLILSSLIDKNGAKWLDLLWNCAKTRLLPWCHQARKSHCWHGRNWSWETIVLRHVRIVNITNRVVDTESQQMVGQNGRYLNSSIGHMRQSPRYEWPHHRQWPRINQKTMRMMMVAMTKNRLTVFDSIISSSTL